MLLRRLAFAAIAAVAALTGLGFLLAAADFGLEARFPGWVAAAIVGGVLVVLAAILLWVALHRRPARELTTEEVVLAAAGLVARSVRAAPEKALIAALIAGVLSEWLGKSQESERTER